MALGASAANLQMGIVGQTLGLAGIGMSMGIVGSWILARSLGGFLYGVSSSDPVTFVTMLVVLGTVATTAGYFPARRASRIDPMTALRSN
jgi:ABC-type antimicrobial peptide transport system permease subunit